MMRLFGALHVVSAIWLRSRELAVRILWPRYSVSPAGHQGGTRQYRDEVQEGQALEVFGLLVGKLHDVVVALPQSLRAQPAPRVLVIQLLQYIGMSSLAFVCSRSAMLLCYTCLRLRPRKGRAWATCSATSVSPMPQQVSHAGS